MSMVSLKEVLRDAQKLHYAVPSFNVVTLEMIEGVFRAAENLSSPVIIGLAARHVGQVDPWLIAGAVEKRATRSIVPIVFHFDHAESIESVRLGVDIGCNSVMIDGSKLSLDKNFELTKAVVTFAKSKDVAVEAELGAVGGVEGEIEGGESQQDYTDPGEASKFANETGIDALAVAIGTVHGLYRSAPNLQFEILKAIEQRTDVPLVQHGGSGLSQNEFARLIDLGITKINVFTELAIRCGDRLRINIIARQPPMSIVDILAGASGDIEKVASDFITTFRSAGRA
jgi:ketose-bisphosphate aldolase